MFAVIVNPVSGGGEAVRLAIRISERIAAMGQESRLFETSGDGDAARQTRAAVEAGADMVLMPADFHAAYQGVLDALADGRLKQARIDDSVRRILTMKYARLD